MIQVGFIGYGSMGSMLVDSFLRSGRLSADEIIVSTKTKSKLSAVKDLWKSIHIAKDNSEVARSAKYIFLCVKPGEVKNVLLEIRENLKAETNLISIAGPITISMLEELVHTKVTKLTPSLTSTVLEGISLICHGSTVTADEITYIEQLLDGISRIKRIKEEDFELAVELTSCMPGFIACIFDEMTTSALRHTDSLVRTDVEEMLLSTLYGTAKLLMEQKIGFEETIRRVATKGGITEEGVKVFRNSLPEILDDMFDSTLQKRKESHDKVNSSWIKVDQL